MQLRAGDSETESPEHSVITPSLLPPALNLPAPSERDGDKDEVQEEVRVVFLPFFSILYLH